MSSVQIRHLTGLIGLGGALCFFAGDMLFYGHLGPGSEYARGVLTAVQNEPIERIFAGGLLGPLAACLCLVGFWHVYLNVRREAQTLGRLMLVFLCAFMVASGSVHTLWAAKGLALRYCSGELSDCAKVLVAIKDFWALAYNLASIPAYPGALLLVYLVLFNKTWNPRWTVIANPALWLFVFPLLPTPPAPFGAILVGGSYNLSWVAFFLVSVLTTWRQPADRIEAASC